MFTKSTASVLKGEEGEIQQITAITTDYKYENTKPKYGDDVSLYYMNTNSCIYNIKNKIVYNSVLIFTLKCVQTQRE